jgi:DNA (cytosine-5)-methyltransferase 1
MRTQTGRNETGLLVAPMLMRFNTPRGSAGLGAQMLTPVSEEARTLTASSIPGVVVPPFLTTLRGGGSQRTAYSTSQALSTVSANGNHHGLVTMQAWAALYGYDSGSLRDHQREPLPTQTTVEGDAIVSGLVAPELLPSVEDCLFRMLEPHEIHAGMAFVPDYIVLGNKRQKVKQLGNAVTPPVAEVLVSALVECITGEALDGAA